MDGRTQADSPSKAWLPKQSWLAARHHSVSHRIWKPTLHFLKSSNLQDMTVDWSPPRHSEHLSGSEHRSQCFHEEMKLETAVKMKKMISISRKKNDKTHRSLLSHYFSISFSSSVFWKNVFTDMSVVSANSTICASAFLSWRLHHFLVSSVSSTHLSDKVCSH